MAQQQHQQSSGTNNNNSSSSLCQRWRRRFLPRLPSFFRGYLWLVYLAVVVLIVYYFRVPLKAYEKMESVLSMSMYFNNLTPKFYVALTGTSSLVSGIILIFEWWYFKNNAIDNGDSEDGSDMEDGYGHDGSKALQDINDFDENGLGGAGECKVWRNPMALFRGAEYQRFTKASGQEPLTFYDLNLSAQDHQTFFCCEADQGKEDLEVMSMAWRERESQSRIAAAKRALRINPECAPALILLAEEQCETIVEAEETLRKALKIVEAMYRRSQAASYPDPESQQKSRDINMLVFIRRRLAMCARRQGRVREAIKMMRDLIKEFPTLNVMNIHENLIEALLEHQAYADAMAVLAKYDSYDDMVPKSATVCYTSALLKARGVADKFEPETMRRRGFSSAELSAVEAIHRAVEFNPHVTPYLLELRPITLPPEHVLKRGDSEAIAYAFCTCSTGNGMLPNPTEKGHLFFPYPACTEAADKELLPSYHEVSVYPKKEFPVWTLFASMFSCSIAMFAVLFHQYPEETVIFIQTLAKGMISSFFMLIDYVRSMVPENIMSLIASKPSASAPATAAAASSTPPPAIV
uniref:Protein ST7 homolog n=1 Tax=Ditylenchus dipsaci TaxID=166011 RepID=A0A915DB70_9BILA